MRSRAAPPKFDLSSYDLSYLDLAKDFVWYRLSRAIRAHGQGDDVLALADLRAIGPLVQAVEAKAEAMGFARPHWASDRDLKRPYIDFLDHVPELLADQERRRQRAGQSAAVAQGHRPGGPGRGADPQPRSGRL